MNQLKNTSAVIEWYKQVTNKIQCLLMHSTESYPSITPDHTSKAIEFAKAISNIPDEDLSVIMQLRKAFSFNEKVL